MSAGGQQEVDRRSVVSRQEVGRRSAISGQKKSERSEHRCWLLLVANVMSVRLAQVSGQRTNPPSQGRAIFRFILGGPPVRTIAKRINGEGRQIKKNAYTLR